MVLHLHEATRAEHKRYPRSPRLERASHLAWRSLELYASAGRTLGRPQGGWYMRDEGVTPPLQLCSSAESDPGFRNVSSPRSSRTGGPQI